MKTLPVLCALALFAAPLSARAADKAPAAGQAADTQAMMEMMAKAATPGPQHEMLRKMEGEWDQKVSHFLDPAQPPQVSHTTATIKSILGGRYTVEESSGQVMGMAFSAMGITGYDNVQKKFVAVWVDNMGTGIIVSEGQADEGGKTIRWTGQMSDPMSGKAVTLRMVTKVIDDDHQTFELFGAGPDGKEAKMMLLEYSRRKTKE